MNKNLIFSRNENFKDYYSQNYYPDFFFNEETEDNHFKSIQIDDFEELKYREKLKKKYLESSFEYFCKTLNSNLDSKDLSSNKYCSIIFKHWFEIFLDIYIQRYFTLERLLKKNDFDSITLIEQHISHIETDYSYDIFESCQDEIWNYCLFQEIYNYLDNEKIKKRFVKIKSYKRSKKSNKKIKRTVLKIYNKIVSYLNSLKIKQFIIMNSYLDFKNELFFQLKLKQFPYRWSEILYNDVVFQNKYNINLRRSFSKEIEAKIDNQFILNFLKIAIMFMPKSFLENFYDIDRSVNKIFNIQNISFIFTSNAYAFDDIFKRLMAKKNILKKTKLIIGQHGIGFPLENNTSIIGVPRSEINFSDYYLLWGNSIEEKDNGFFNSTILCKRRYLKDYYISNVNKSIIQIIQPNIELQYKLFNTKSYYINFFKDFDRFLNILDKKITQNIFIKIHSSDFTNSIRKNIWRKKILYKKSISSNIDKNFSKNKITIINKKTRIFVFNYFSTGFLECMSENIPCIIYCPGFENYFDNKFLEIIKSLIDCNILFDKYYNMNNFLNENFKKIDKWWYSDNLQRIRINFCYKFAQKHNSNHIFDILKKINEK